MFGKPYSFRFLWVGQMLANLGDVVYIVSIIKMISDTTGSVIYMSLVPFINTFSALISSFFAPLLIEKLQLKSILTYSQFGKTVLLFFLTGIVFFVENQLPVIFFLVGCISFLDGWASPARNALVPAVVPEDKLVKSNSLLAITDQIVQLIAWPIGSIALISWGEKSILVISAILFILSTGCMMFIHAEKVKNVRKEESTWLVLKEGWSLMFNSKQLRTIGVMDVFGTVANGVWIAAILFVYVDQALQKPESWWGFINGAFFAGMLIAGMLLFRYSAVVEKNLGWSIMFSVLALAVLTFLFAITSLPWGALLLSFLFGFPQMAFEVAETTILQNSARQQLLAKIYSVRGTLLFAAFGLSSLLMGWITQHFGVRVSFFISSLLFACSFFIAFWNKKVLLFGSKVKKEQLQPEK